ncbi:Pentatricopeptide repeat-containing protein, partial [Mucuna pruriens]
MGMFCEGIVCTLIQRSKTLPHLLQLHSLFIKSSLDHHPFLISQLLLSASSISLPFAASFFHSLPTPPPLFAWNTLIRAFATTAPHHSLSLFRLLQTSPLRPDNFTFPFALKASAHSSSLPLGRTLHSLTVKTGFRSDTYVANALLNMYSHCHAVRSARKVFDETTDKDVVSWSSMIAAYAACNSSSDAFHVFRDMKLANQKPNSVTFLSLLSASTKTLDSSAGQSLHSYIIREQIEMDVALGTALFEMYAKCGRIEKALLVFNSMGHKNLQSCTIMISALADHGRPKDAISLFSQMESMGLQPDSLSFAVILSACSHVGLVSEGRKYFDRMVKVYGIKPSVEHYGCMVDMLGRAGLIQEAYDIIKGMPLEPNDVILRTFLGACRNHGWLPSFDDDLLSKLESELGANYVLTANVFSTCASWKDANDLRVAMKQKGLKKIPGCSWVEIDAYGSTDMTVMKLGKGQGEFDPNNDQEPKCFDYINDNNKTPMLYKEMTTTNFSMKERKKWFINLMKVLGALVELNDAKVRVKRHRTTILNPSSAVTQIRAKPRLFKTEHHECPQHYLKENQKRVR